MKIQQVKNYQTNFKSGIVAEKGAVALLKRMRPAFAKALLEEPQLVSAKEDLHGLDFIWFAESKRELAGWMSTILCIGPTIEKAFFHDSMLKPNTMENLVDLSRHLYEA